MLGKTLKMFARQTRAKKNAGRGPYAGLFHSEFLVIGKEVAANNFARGHYV